MPRAVFPALFCRDTASLRELRELQRLADPVEFRSDETIFSDRDRADTVFGLSSGIVRLYKSLPDGRRQILSFALPGDFLGMPLDRKR
jgi:CRP/FNR family transcriptional regulator